MERGLIGPGEGEKIWQRHIENCLPVTTLLPMSKSKVADVGSGAGLPGIVVALARPELRMSLIEPLQRRVDFLYEAIEELELENVEVIRARAESVKGSYNYVLARAVAPLPRLIESTWHLIAPGGSLLALKGESVAREMLASELKRFKSHRLHEINLDDLPTGRIIEAVRAG